LAAAPDATSTPRNGRNASRLSFAKITDTLTVPDLLALQTESFDWLVGSEAWKARVAEAEAAGRTDLAGAHWLRDVRDAEDSPEDVGYEEADDGEGFRYERAIARQPRHR
jgi:DNA-directed RNA polymerase subunit beta